MAAKAERHVLEHAWISTAPSVRVSVGVTHTCTRISLRNQQLPEDEHGFVALNLNDVVVVACSS